MDASTESELIGVLDTFCSGFADRNADAVMGLIGPDPNLAVVTSEESLLRGPVELQRFIEDYIAGATTYSWTWDRHDVFIAGSVAWLLAEGTETAVSGGHVQQHPYRMTMVLERRQDRWVLMHVHGSSPH